MPQRVFSTNTAAALKVEESLRKLRQSLGLESNGSYPKEALREAEKISEGLGWERVGPLKDRRDIPFVTLDPAQSLDLDQAMHIEREGQGYLVRYAISAVGRMIETNSALDRETQQRGQTIYGPDGSVPLHPELLSHDVASLLPGQDRPAYLWYHHLDESGELQETWVELARVRSVAKLSYDQVDKALDGDIPLPNEVPHDFLALLREVGTKRIECETRRGGISVNLPEQVVEHSDKGYRLAFRRLTRAESWNAQISLLTGMAAARLMTHENIGILRTMPAFEQRDLDRIRSVARMLGLAWPKEMGYPEFVRSINTDSPEGSAFLTEAMGMFRAAGYTSLPLSEGASEGKHTVDNLEHAALAAPYAHVTAPLRRLVDKYGLEVCLAICEQRPVEQWVHEGMKNSAEIMRESSKKARKFQRDALSIIEALVLEGREGETFEAVVTDVFLRRRSNKESDGTVIISDPAVEGNVNGDRLRRGARVKVQLTLANPDTGEVKFQLVSTQ